MKKKNIDELIKRFSLNQISMEEYYILLKFILDPETEISNFLVHISQLNDRICDYIIIKKSNMLSDETKKNLILSLRELYEDKSAHFTFCNMFNLLMIMNVAVRIQDEYYPAVKLYNLDMSSFKEVKVDDKRMVKKINELIIEGSVPKNKEKELYKEYWMDKIRNSLMHGKFKPDINELGELEFTFFDNYKGRQEQLKVESSKLENFSMQKHFYENIPNNSEYINNNWKEI